MQADDTNRAGTLEAFATQFTLAPELLRIASVFWALDHKPSWLVCLALISSIITAGFRVAHGRRPLRVCRHS